MKYILYLASIIFLTSACSFYEEYASGKFDPEKELDYLRYWCDPNNRMNNESAGNPNDIRSQKECLEEAGHIGN